MKFLAFPYARTASAASTPKAAVMRRGWRFRTRWGGDLRGIFWGEKGIRYLII